MRRLRIVAVAAFVAFAGMGAAEAAPANLGNVTPPAVAESEAATLVYHRHRQCWPVRRWVWTHWGWRYRYVGQRCAPRHYYHYPRYRYRYWY